MAQQRNSGRRSGKSKNSHALPIAVIFWLVFFITVTGVFLINRETIRNNFTLLTQRLNSPPSASQTTAEEPAVEQTPESDSASSDGDAVARPSDVPPAATPGIQTPAPAAIPATGPETPERPSSAPQPSSASQSSPTPQLSPAAQTGRPPPVQPPAPRPVETRDRNLYFTQVGNDGTILRSRINRKITLSDSPMQDSLNALLAGPNAEEKRRGLLSLIPANTRILSATVRGSTAYISFSEEFQYNTYGVEGYAAQLNQIVWTVTEFPNVQDVQILIEGRRVDYLGEGIWIGSPIRREAL
ncbi:MAG: GerMN domain-containing protein [Treponema sp.]|nr:GerMN domain-containing protein [Treponema sp.]